MVVILETHDGVEDRSEDMFALLCANGLIHLRLNLFLKLFVNQILGAKVLAQSVLYFRKVS